MALGTLKHKDYCVLDIADNIVIFEVRNSPGAPPSGIFNHCYCFATQNQKALFFCVVTFAVSIAKGWSEGTKRSKNPSVQHMLLTSTAAGNEFCFNPSRDKHKNSSCHETLGLQFLQLCSNDILGMADLYLNPS